MGIVFDGSITLGALVNAAVLLIGFVVAFTRIGGRIDLLALRVQSLEKAVNNTEGIDKRLATIEERVTNHVNLLVNFQADVSSFRNHFNSELTNLRSDINNLRRGDGWITGPRRPGVDGEYSG